MKKIFALLLVVAIFMGSMLSCDTEKVQGDPSETTEEATAAETTVEETTVEETTVEETTVEETTVEETTVEETTVEETTVEETTVEETTVEETTVEETTVEETTVEETTVEEPHPLEAELTASATLVPAVCEHVYTIEKPKGSTWAQGGCIVDGYYYQIFITKDLSTGEGENKDYIVKYDMENRSIVQTSEALLLNHANDMTYNSRLGYLVVCHHAPNRTRVSYIDPNTLALVKSIELAQNIYCIDYNAKRDQYVIGLNGTKDFYITDADFNVISELYPATDRTASCTAQGVGSDDKYIYFPMYNPNVISVYDWNGNFITLIALDVENKEPENLAVIGDEIYVACAISTAAHIYKISDLRPTY